MIKILRSLIDADGSVAQDSLLRNYIYISQSNLSFVDAEDKDIWNYIQNYAVNYSACPTSDTVRDFLEREKEYTTIDRLEEITSFHRTYENSDFENLVEEEVKAQKDHEAQIVLTTAAQILGSGLTMKEGRDTVTYKGHRDAIKYVMKHADSLLTSDRGGQTKANLPYDTEAAREEFQRVCAAKSKTWGIITGLREIDMMCRGIKPGEMWIHAAFTGQLKSTLARNWAYRAVFLLQRNVYYLSLEMPVDQIRRMIYVMHSSHPKFEGQGWPTLTYRLIRDGEDEEGNPITEHQKEFYHHIIEDIEENRGTEYGSLIVKSPDEDMTITKLRNDLEITHQQVPLHMCIVDHFALMKSENPRGNYYTELNEIVRDSKRLALSFNHGERIPVLGLLQINRSGKTEADKNEGIYQLQALADSNEAERSSDVITTTYLDKMGKIVDANQVKFGCLKNRDNPHFPPFTANVDWNIQRIYNEFATNDLNALNATSVGEVQDQIIRDNMLEQGTDGDDVE